MGTEGRILIHHPWWAATRITIITQGKESETIDYPVRGGGYTHEAEAFMDLIRNGDRDSNIMPLDESLSIMKTMDGIREQIGFKYPME